MPQPRSASQKVVFRGLMMFGVLLVGAILVTFVFMLSFKSAPTVNGGGFYDYLESAEWDEIPHDLAPISPDPITFLAFGTEKEKSQWDAYYEKLWRTLPHTIKRRLRSPYRSDEIQRNALIALGNYGSVAKMALPSILNVATNSQEFNKAFAMRSALFIGHDTPEVVEAFHQLLSNPMTRPTAAAAIYSTKRSPPGIASSLLPLDWSDSSRLPLNELLAVAILGQEAASEIPSIVTALDHPDGLNRGEGNLLTALSQMGPVATNAIPSLIQRLKSSHSESTKVAVMRALTKMGPAAKDSIPVLISLLQDKDPVVKCFAALSIGKIDGLTQDCMHAMLESLESKNDSKASLLCDVSPIYGLQSMGLNKLQSILWMMGEIAPHPLMDQAIPKLKKMFNENPRHWGIGLLARVVWRQEKDSELILPHLMNVLNESKNPQSTIWACVVLGEMGINAKEAVIELENAGQRNLNVRQAARDALKKIHSKTNSP